jgi:hypothetical protein
LTASVLSASRIAWLRAAITSGRRACRIDYAEPLAAFQSGIASLTESGHVGKRDAAMRRGRGEGAQGPGLDVGPLTIAWTPCGLKG